MASFRWLPVLLFAICAAAIYVFWSWLGAPVRIADGPSGKLDCASYAPFRGSQSPLDPTTVVSAAQIDEDLSRLSAITSCVRTYSVDAGLDQIAPIAARHGMTVMQGLWLSNHRDKNRYQIDTAVKLANAYPDTIRAVIVGNEVLLRGDLSPVDLEAALREVKSKVKVPVTYADVWEFWLRNRDLAAAADFVTIHILPYWEDFPIPARNAAAHVDAIHAQVAAAFPGKDILIGEVGWPSAGRMREGALPSLSNEALVIQSVLTAARRNGYRFNIIEATDAPWKRALEGTVGGYWGLLDDASRAAKFTLGAPVSDHPHWRWQALAGIVVAALTFGAALFGARGRAVPVATGFAVGAMALTGGALAGWSIEKVLIESLGTAGWIRNALLAAASLLASPLCAAALTAGSGLGSFAGVLNRDKGAKPDAYERLTAWLMIVVVVMATIVALGLVFDPRYRDFPFPQMTAAALPLLLLRLQGRSAQRARGAAETLLAAMFACSVVFIVPSETLKNWQSLWLCAALGVLALTLAWAPGGRGSMRAAQSPPPRY